jgi:RimJ/RimL family protein N-acetyltransferase
MSTRAPTLDDVARAFKRMPELTDGTIRLRRWRNDDVPALLDILADGSVARWIVGMPWPYTADHAKAFLRRTRRDWKELVYVHLAITEVPSGRALGGVGISLRLERQAGEIGYWVAPGDRGRGIAPAAVALLTRWAFDELWLARIELVIHIDNAPSQAVAAKAGFTREGVLRAFLLHRGRRGDYWMYSRLIGDPEPRTPPARPAAN